MDTTAAPQIMAIPHFNKAVEKLKDVQNHGKVILIVSKVFVISQATIQLCKNVKKI